MKYWEGRLDNLRNRLNAHLKKITRQEKDFFATLGQDELVDFKIVLSDINNVLTLKMTISAVDWLCDNFQLANTLKERIVATIDGVKPNTNGFDICINESDKKIVAEVKCIVPINNGNRYGAAERNAILDDAQKLFKGKRQLADTKDFIKVLFLIDLGERTNDAIAELLRPSRSKSENPLRVNRHKIKGHISLLTDMINTSDLTTDRIYIKTIKLN